MVIARNNQQTINKTMSGISQDKVKKYWDKRSTEQGIRTVGPNNWEINRQNKIYSVRNEFITSKVPHDKYVLDYGCGTGRYSRLFAPTLYLGVDICENLLAIAARDNPEYQYELLPNPIPKPIDFPFDVFFTATVLQHNDDEGFERILASLQAISGRRPLIFCIYENTADKQGEPHVCFRSVKRYLEFISKYFHIIKHDSWAHVVHGEEHSLILVEAFGSRMP